MNPITNYTTVSAEEINSPLWIESALLTSLSLPYCPTYTEVPLGLSPSLWFSGLLFPKCNTLCGVIMHNTILQSCFKLVSLPSCFLRFSGLGYSPACLVHEQFLQMLQFLCLSHQHSYCSVLKLFFQGRVLFFQQTFLHCIFPNATTCLWTERVTKLQVLRRFLSPRHIVPDFHPLSVCM